MEHFTAADWVTIIAAVAAAACSVITALRTELNRKKIEEVRSIVNGNSERASQRIEQLSAVMQNRGIPVPPSEKPNPPAV